MDADDVPIVVSGLYRVKENLLAINILSCLHLEKATRIVSNIIAVNMLVVFG